MPNAMSKLFSRDSWAEILEALSSNWFRTVLTAFGVLWGIFILVILLAAGNGLENGIKQGFSGMATNSMFMWSQTASQPYKGLPKGRRYNFKTDDVPAIKQNVQGLRFVSPRNQLGGFRGSNNVVRGLQTGAFNVYGDYPEITYGYHFRQVYKLFRHQRKTEGCHYRQWRSKCFI